MVTKTTTHHTDMSSQIDALARVFHLIIGYRMRGTGLEALLFLEIARGEGCTSRHLQETLGVNQSTISRETRSLGSGKVERGRRRKCKRRDGKGWIYSYKDHSEPTGSIPKRRAPRADRLRYALTDRGREILNDAMITFGYTFPHTCSGALDQGSTIRGMVTVQADHTG